MSEPAASVEISRQIAFLGDRYTNVARIGAGGMGYVLKAHDTSLMRDVAIKVLNARKVNSKEVIRFQKEARVASKLKHKGLIEVLDFGSSPSGQLYLVMEYAPGLSLAALLRREKRLDIARALDIAVQICDAMIHAHNLGVIHRDLKPANIRCSDDFSIKVLDFGIALLHENMSKSFDTDSETSPHLNDIRETDQDSGLERLVITGGRLAGSPPYMSPEQIKTEPLDSRTDIYSLGCLLYEMVCGEPPYMGDTAIETLAMHLQAEIPRLSRALDNSSLEALDRILARMLAKAPDERFTSMMELKESLLACMHEFSAAGDYSHADKPKSENSAFYSHIYSPLVFAAIAFIFLVTGFFYWLKESSKSEKHIRMKKSEAQKTLTLHGDGASFLKEMKNTQYVWAPPVFGKCEDESLALLASTEEHLPLDLSGTDVSGAGLSYLRHWQDLKRIDFESSRISDEGIANLNYFPLLEELRLQNTSISDAGLKRLRKMPFMRALNVEKCKGLSDAGIQHICRIAPALQNFQLSESGATGECLVYISRLTELEVLTLKDLSLKNPDLEILASAPSAKKLRRLYLGQNTDLSDESISSLSSFVNLQYLDITNCPLITAECLDRIRKRLPSCKIDYGYQEDRRFHETMELAPDLFPPMPEL